ncbi:MAG: hypothetical protein CM1200mP14_10680 [Gammaproteobacteria bacterium]|nr:MAG: hypothetical protein CM1200mP14_10680 [Gammaproteobacteria bacterium]
MFVLSINPNTKEVIVGTRAELFDDIVLSGDSTGWEDPLRMVQQL